MSPATATVTAHAGFGDGLEAAWKKAQPRLPGSDWMHPVRAEALARVIRQGLPGRRQEWWKYADLASMRTVAPPLVEAQALVKRARPEWLAGLDLIEAELNQGLVVHLPAADRLPDGFEVMRLADALAVPSLWLRPWMSPSQSILDNLNLAFASDGLLVRVGRNTRIATPLLVHARRNLAGTMAHDRGVIVLEDGASLTVLEVQDHAGSGECLGTSRLNISLGEGAHLRHVRVCTNATGTIHVQEDSVELARDAQYELVTLAKGGQLHRSQFNVSLSGERASCRLAAAFAVQPGEVTDFSSEVRHVAPNAVSRLLSKGTARSGGRGVVQGRVCVEQAAQGTDSHQMARGLLIGEGGEIFHRPELEIYADDVKCGHGAATGALDESQMFYLQSRGIEEAEARRMLLAAYFAPVVDSAPETLSAALANWVDAHLLAEGTRS